MGHMAWKQDTLCAQVNSGEKLVGNVHTPVLRLLLDVSFEAEMISAKIVACEKALVIFPFMFIGDATANLKERGE